MQEIYIDSQEKNKTTMLAGQLANRGLIHCMGVAFNVGQGMCATLYVFIKGTQFIPSHASSAQTNIWARPAVATIKFKIDAVNTEIGAKRNTKRRF